MGNCQRQPPRRQCRGQLDPTGGEAAATAHKAHDCDPAEKTHFHIFGRQKILSLLTLTRIHMGAIAERVPMAEFLRQL